MILFIHFFIIVDCDMYPYLTLGSVTISLVWIGIVIACCYFLFIVYTRSKHFRLDFFLFLFYAPLLLIVPYCISKIIWYFLAFRFSQPLDWDIFLYFFDPHGSPFSFVWLVVGVCLFFVYFLTRPYIFYSQEKWLYTIARGIVLSTILAWFFLVFGDWFMGKATESWFAIHPFTENATSLAKFDKVYPVWLILSFWSFVAFMISVVIEHYSKKYHWWLLLWLFLLSRIFVFPFQHYPQYLVWDLWWVRLDIKYYIAIFFGIFCLTLHALRYKFDPIHEEDDHHHH